MKKKTRTFETEETRKNDAKTRALTKTHKKKKVEKRLMKKTRTLEKKKKRKRSPKHPFDITHKEVDKMHRTTRIL